MSRETNAVKTMSAVAVILIVNCLVPSLEAKDIIRDKSPDGKFALRITEEDAGRGAAIINLKSKDDVVGLEIYQNFTEEAHLFIRFIGAGEPEEKRENSDRAIRVHRLTAHKQHLLTSDSAIRD